jgi:hypothetical protein
VPPASLLALIDDLTPAADAFAARRAELLVFCGDDTVRLLRQQPTAAAIRLIDCNPQLLGRSGSGPWPPTVLVIDRSQRVALHHAATPDLVGACLRCLDALPHEPARDVVLPAPLLLLANLLSPQQCRHLIEQFETGATIDSGMATIDADGTPRTRLDHGKKRRRDLLIAPDDPQHAVLQDLLLRRCGPEITRAFQGAIAYTDRILVARYVNLNTEDYEGGELLFPECNDNRYSPPTGGGIIFSTGLLHEATPVTRGRRYVLLTFFHGEAAEQRRQVYLARSGAVTPPR